VASSSGLVPSSYVTLSAHSSTALGAFGDSDSTSTTTPGIPLSHTIHSVAIKSLVPYTLDLQVHNYTKCYTLFSTVLGWFSLLHHVEDDATYPTDLKCTKENLSVGN
jgi:hypothetical protein